jgi:hypothetical protein
VFFPFVLKHTLGKAACDADVEHVAAAGHDVWERAVLVHGGHRVGTGSALAVTERTTAEQPRILPLHFGNANSFREFESGCPERRMRKGAGCGRRVVSDSNERRFTVAGSRQSADLNFAACEFEALVVEEHDGGPARGDEIFASPLGQNAADGEQGGAGHLGQFFAGQKDFDAVMSLFADMLAEAEEGQCESSRDAFGGHFAESFFQFVEPGHEDLAHVLADLGMILNQSLHGFAIPRQSRGGFHGARGGGMAARLRFGKDAEQVAGPVHPEDDLAAAGTQLRDFDAAGANQKEVMDVLALCEQKFLTGERARPGGRGDVLYLSRRQAGTEFGRAEKISAFGDDGRG